MSIYLCINQTLRRIKTKYYGHGKLLLTGEYAVLDGAKALALPTKKGQKMVIKRTTSSDLIWQSLDEKGKVWFESTISLFDFSALTTTDQKTSEYLQKVLKNAVRLNSEFLSQWNGFKIETQLEFPLDWGLGFQLNLDILRVAEWAEVNPLMLYFKIDDGSGYDVACAFADGPITYLNSQDEVSYTEIDFDPKFKNDLYFIHLGEKKNSAQGIKEYLKAVKQKQSMVQSIQSITDEILDTKTLTDFEALLEKHEDIIHKHTGFEKVKDKHFKDFSGAVKSLGAWGGDFVLATSSQSSEKTVEYFRSKGFPIVIPYQDLIL